ncbi:MAG TPA: hypothetical protein VIK11_03105 [Tepidiformaceae bacterium]|jgi:hypothetical protein
MTLTKQVEHVGVRFYRIGGVELVLVPLMKEVASFTRSAGDGYFLVSLIGEPGTAYPLDLRSAASYDPEYLGKKLRLDRRGYGYTPEELAQALGEIARDMDEEEARD